jgi:hypothetical protein
MLPIRFYRVIMNIRYSKLNNPRAGNAAAVQQRMSNDAVKRMQLAMKSGLALAAILLAFMAMPTLTHAEVPTSKVESDAKPSETSLKSKAESNARYKRLRARAHRNAARAKAHARAVRAEAAAS